MGPHLPLCMQVSWRTRGVHSLSCDCSFTLDQAEQSRRWAVQRITGLVDAGVSTISLEQVSARLRVLDQYRAAGQYAAADRERARLAEFGVEVRMTPDGSTFQARRGHRIRDYAGWTF